MAVAALAIGAAYANHFGNSFHFDDSHAVESNLFLRDLRNIPRFFTDARSFSSLPANQSYRPIVSTTLAIDYALGGLNPVAFQIDSFLWFFAQCVLLYFIFRRLLGDEWWALFGAALYGLHTAVAETVNYVIARGDILSTFFALLALYLYSLGGRARRLHWLAAAAAVLSKEQGAVAAPLIFLYAGLFEQKRSLSELCQPKHFWQALKPAIPSFIVCGALGVLSIKMAQSWTPGGASRAWYALTQPWVMLHYFAMFFLPVDLSADTDWTLVNSLSDLRIHGGLAFLAALFFVAFRASRSERARPLAFGLITFFVALLPTSSLVPLAEVTNDHRMYFPFAGLAVAAACALSLAVQARPSLARPMAAFCCAALLALGIGVHFRNRVWRSEETLWRDVTEKSPNNGRGWMNYGLALMSRGAYDESERCYEKALALAPGYGYAHVNLAILKGAKGDRAAAEQHFRKGLALMPGVPSFRYFFARWLDSVGRSAEAVALLREAIAMSPAEPSSRQLLLSILARERRWSELAAAAQDALRIRSDDPAALGYLRTAQANAGREPPHAAPAQQPAPQSMPASTVSEANALLDRSLALYRSGDFEGSLRAADGALTLRPGFAEAFNNKCSALNELGRFREAAAACEAALRIRPDFELARNNLAVARQHLQ